jgi:hypothetical protein
VPVIPAGAGTRAGTNTATAPIADTSRHRRENRAVYPSPVPPYVTRAAPPR